MDENIELLDSITSEEEVQPKEITTIPTLEDYNLLAGQYKTLSESNKKLYARFKKAEEKEKEEKPVAKEPDASAPQPAIDVESIESRILLRTQGYTADEISYMETVAKSKGIKLSESANDPFVKGGIESLRAQAKSEQATPPSSSRSTSHKEKSWTEMTPEERKANFTRVNEEMKRRSMGNE